jgi:hypothetical protein
VWMGRSWSSSACRWSRCGSSGRWRGRSGHPRWLLTPLARLPLPDPLGGSIRSTTA